MRDSVLRDLRFTLRMLAARPGWTGAAILCLAIATGANTAAFTLINGLLLRPLPFDDARQLVMVALQEATAPSPRPFTLSEYRDLAREAGTGTMLLARTFFPLSLGTPDGTRMAQAELVSGNYFETLRIQPFAGRFFDEGADRDGAVPVAVLSHRLWTLRFGASRSAIGQSARVNGRPVMIVGVAPPGFVGAMQLVAADLWLPAAMQPALAGSADAGIVPMFGVMGRLPRDVTVTAAAARLTSVFASIPRAAGVSGPVSVIVKPAAGFGVPVAVEGLVVSLAWCVYAMMALLMTVACANVAALVLARGTGRSREIAIRLSLGASRMHIARQLLTESIVLALLGCAAGTVVALWLTQALVARLTTPFQFASYALDVHADGRVFAYSAAAAAAAAVLCGIAPIRFAGRVDVVEVLKQSGQRGCSRESMRTLNGMVILQFAVSTTLLVGASILMRTYVDARGAHPGFETTGLLTSTLDMEHVSLDRQSGARLYQRVMERVSALPGVTAVALTRDLPIGPAPALPVVADTGTLPRGEPFPAGATVVSSRYFQTLGVAVRQGRSFADNEPSRPLVAVVNEAMARRLWPEASPVGRTFRLNQPDAEPIEVIGVVPDIPGGSRDGRAQPAFYQPFPHQYGARMSVVMRVQGDAALLFDEVRRTIREVNQDLAVVDLRTIDEALDLLVSQRRLPAVSLTVVGVLGLLLSAVGLYGVVAYTVRERAHELGLRLALGARPADLRLLILRQGFGVVAIGMFIGAAGSLALTQLSRATLPGARPVDPAALGAVCAVLIATAFAALYIPAAWASRLEPSRTLRSE